MLSMTRSQLVQALDHVFAVCRQLKDDGCKVTVLPDARVVGQDETGLFRGYELETREWIAKVEELRKARGMPESARG
jgi:hypothetical protein